MKRLVVRQPTSFEAHIVALLRIGPHRRSEMRNFFAPRSWSYICSSISKLRNECGFEIICRTDPKGDPEYELL